MSREGSQSSTFSMTSSSPKAKEGYCGAVRVRPYQASSYWSTRYEQDGKENNQFDWYVRYGSFKEILETYFTKKSGLYLDARSPASEEDRGEGRW